LHWAQGRSHDEEKAEDYTGDFRADQSHSDGGRIQTHSIFSTTSCGPFQQARRAPKEPKILGAPQATPWSHRHRLITTRKLKKAFASSCPRLLSQLICFLSRKDRVGAQFSNPFPLRPRAVQCLRDQICEGCRSTLEITPGKDDHIVQSAWDADGQGREIGELDIRCRILSTPAVARSHPPCHSFLSHCSPCLSPTLPDIHPYSRLPWPFFGIHSRRLLTMLGFWCRGLKISRDDSQSSAFAAVVRVAPDPLAHFRPSHVDSVWFYSSISCLSPSSPWPCLPCFNHWHPLWTFWDHQCVRARRHTHTHAHAHAHAHTQALALFGIRTISEHLRF
jgi:hypothetical protein